MAAQPKPIHLLLLGCRGVGKTKLKDQYADAVRPAPITTGNKREDDRRDRMEQIRLKYGLEPLYAASSKTITMQGKIINLYIWENPRETTVMDNNIMGVLLIYDITNMASFEHIPADIITIQLRYPDADILLVGNKCDCADSMRVISKERGQQMASSLGISFRETHTEKSGIASLNDAFETLVTAVLLKQDNLNMARTGDTGDDDKARTGDVDKARTGDDDKARTGGVRECNTM